MFNWTSLLKISSVSFATKAECELQSIFMLAHILRENSYNKSEHESIDSFQDIWIKVFYNLKMNICVFREKFH